jgi:hypothetical protein
VPLNKRAGRPPARRIGYEVSATGGPTTRAAPSITLTAVLFAERALSEQIGSSSTLSTGDKRDKHC